MWWSQWESDTIKHKDKYDASSTEEWKDASFYCSGREGKKYIKHKSSPRDKVHMLKAKRTRRYKFVERDCKNQNIYRLRESVCESSWNRLRNCHINQCKK